MISLGAVFIWRIFFTEHVNLIPDECSYWAWSRRLDWSYFDNSGMTAYLIRLSTELFGASTPLSVRFPFLVISALTTYLVYRTSVDLFGNRERALGAAALFNLMPIALLGGSAAMHDNALIFFWAGGLWAAARFVKSNDARWFYVIGVFSGLAILSKYTGVLLPFSLFLFLLWSPEHRSRLLTKEPWLGAVIAGFFCLPIVWWNVQHDWASLHHILFIGSGSVSWPRRMSDGLGYHLAQFLLVSPLLYIGLIAGSISALARSIRCPDPVNILLLCFGAPLALFGVIAFKGHVEANWAVMGYISTGILAVQVIAERLNTPTAGKWTVFSLRYLKWAVIVAVVPVVLVVGHAWLGLLPLSMERMLGKADRVIWETRGWDRMGRHVGELRRPDDVVAGDSYQLCALLEFNVPGTPYARYVAPWKRPTQFDVWEPTLRNLKGRTILFVTPRKLLPSSEVRSTIYENFARVESLPAYEFMYHGEPIRTMYMYRGFEFDPDSTRPLPTRSLFYDDRG